MEDDSKLHLKYFRLFLFLSCCIFIARGVILAPDSNGYIDLSLCRPPVYPLVINFFTSLLATKLFTVVVFQLLFGHIAIYYFINTLQQEFKFNHKLKYLLTAILITPYLGKVGNYILTESICYPTFLFCFTFLINSIIHKSLKYFFYTIILTIILTLTRGQFLFIYPVLGIYLINIYIDNKHYYKLYARKKTMITLVIAAILLTPILEKSYHYYVNDRFILTPFSGIHLLTPPLYLADISAQQYIQDPFLKKIFINMHSKMQEEKLTYQHAVGVIDPPYHFYSSYDRIVYKIIEQTFNTNNIYDMEQINIQCNKLAIILFKNNWYNTIKHCILNATGYLGNYYHALLIVLTLFTSLFAYYQTRNNHLLITFYATIMLLSNAMLISIIQTPRNRYSFYTEIIWVCFICIGLYNLLLKTYKSRLVQHET